MAVKASNAGTRRRLGGLVSAGIAALLLAGCAAAEVPMPFISNPEPETTEAVTTPTSADTGVTGSTAPAVAGEAAPVSRPAVQTQAAQTQAAQTQAAQTQSGQSQPAQGRAATEKLPFPSFAKPPIQPNDRPVLNDADQKKMQAELEGLAKNRENQMRQEIEQGQ